MTVKKISKVVKILVLELERVGDALEGKLIKPLYVFQFVETVWLFSKMNVMMEIPLIKKDALAIVQE